MDVSKTLETRGLGLEWVGVGSEVDWEAMKEGRRLEGRTKRREKGSRGELTSWFTQTMKESGSLA